MVSCENCGKEVKDARILKDTHFSYQLCKDCTLDFGGEWDE